MKYGIYLVQNFIYFYFWLHLVLLLHGLSLAAVHGLLIAVASLVVEHRL